MSDNPVSVTRSDETPFPLTIHHECAIGHRLISTVFSRSWSCDPTCNLCHSLSSLACASANVSESVLITGVLSSCGAISMRIFSSSFAPRRRHRSASPKCDEYEAMSRRSTAGLVPLQKPCSSNLMSSSVTEVLSSSWKMTRELSSDRELWIYREGRGAVSI